MAKPEKVLVYRHKAVTRLTHWINVLALTLLLMSGLEIFNALNTANFDLPNRIFGTPNFGRIFSAKDPREMQFGARISF